MSCVIGYLALRNIFFYDLIQVHSLYRVITVYEYLCKLGKSIETTFLFYDDYYIFFYFSLKTKQLHK